MPFSLVFALLLPVAGEATSVAMNATASFSTAGLPHAVASEDNRSIYSIVWSCVTTLFACAWVAVHPDIPSLEDEGLRHFLHRLKLLMWVLISPEAVLVWAWRQHRGAQALRYMFNDSEQDVYSEHWSLSHAHFLQMGGFVICPNREKEELNFIASPGELRNLSKQGFIDFPKYIKTRDITDRGKADGLAYFVAIGQLLWFVTQCIARIAVGLSITLFELAAVSFAPITIIMYLLWWGKPQNAQAPIFIVVNPDKRLPEPETDEHPDKTLPFPFSFIQHAVTSFEDMLGTTHRSQSIPSRSRRLPAFYAYPHEHKPLEIPDTPLIAGSILGTIFGIIHILGWNFKFPTRTEKLLWRASSAVIIVAPLLVVVNIFSARKGLHPKANVRDSGFSAAENQTAQRTSFRDLFRRVWHGIAAVVLALGYIAARLILLGVMCSSLRALTSKQLQGVDWITNIPHIL